MALALLISTPTGKFLSFLDQTQRTHSKLGLVNTRAGVKLL